jgi:hypothetical protein
MAKANGISKKLLAKKDMNFFAEFTANAAKQARMLGYGVAVGVLVVFVVVFLIVAFLIRNTLIKNQIKELETLLASPDYATLEQEYALLKEQLNDMNNYYYALTQMRKNVDLINPAPTDLPDVIAKCIPSDSYLTNYSITNSALDFSGYTFTYYSPVDMVNMLNDKGVFAARPSITTARVDLKDSVGPDELINGDMVEAINNYYTFSVSGALVSNVHVSIARYQDGVDSIVTLGGIETLDVRAGDSYTVDGISSYSYAGVTYRLSRIMVDGVQVDDASFNVILESNQYVDVARGNHEVKFYYMPASSEG